MYGVVARGERLGDDERLALAVAGHRDDDRAQVLAR